MEQFKFDYLVGVVDDVYVNSGISPLNSVILARQRLIDEEHITDNNLIRQVLLSSLYVDVQELNLRGMSELL